MAVLSFIKSFLVAMPGLMIIGLIAGISFNLLNPNMKGLSISDFKLIGSIITIDILLIIIVHLNSKRLS